MRDLDADRPHVYALYHWSSFTYRVVRRANGQDEKSEEAKKRKETKNFDDDLTICVNVFIISFSSTSLVCRLFAGFSFFSFDLSMIMILAFANGTR